MPELPKPTTLITIQALLGTMRRSNNLHEILLQKNGSLGFILQQATEKLLSRADQLYYLAVLFKIFKTQVIFFGKKWMINT